MTDIELRLLNDDFEQIAIVRDFSSLQWTQKYYDPGDFALQVGMHYAHLLPDARYVYRASTDTLGIVDAPRTDKMFMMRGRFAEILLMRRSINRRVTYTGNVEDVCRQIVTDFCIENPEPERNIDHLILGEYHGGLGGHVHLGGQWDEDGNEVLDVTLQPYGKTVHDAIRELLTANELSFRLKYDFVTNDLAFEVFEGVDRTQRQDDNEWCVFSSEWFNVIDETFTRTLDTRNFAYVVNGNEDNNEDEIIIEIEIPDGRPRSEIWVQDNTRLTEDMTEEEFEAAIRQTGLNKLAEFNVADTGECVIDVNDGMTYGIGDRCTYINNRIGITFEQRITEIREVYEPNTVSTSVILGKEQLTEGKKIIRRVT